VPQRFSRASGSSSRAARPVAIRGQAASAASWPYEATRPVSIVDGPAPLLRMRTTISLS